MDKKHTQPDKFQSPIWICVFTETFGNISSVTVIGCSEWYLPAYKMLAIPGNYSSLIQFAASDNASDGHVIEYQAQLWELPPNYSFHLSKMPPPSGWLVTGLAEQASDMYSRMGKTTLN